MFILNLKFDVIFFYGCASFSSIVPFAGTFFIFPLSILSPIILITNVWEIRLSSCFLVAAQDVVSLIQIVLKMATFATVEALNTHLATRSYVTGYSLTADDKAALANLRGFPCAKSTPHSYRWALHISALTGARWLISCYLHSFLHCWNTVVLLFRLQNTSLLRNLSVSFKLKLNTYIN